MSEWVKPYRRVYFKAVECDDWMETNMNDFKVGEVGHYVDMDANEKVYRRSNNFVVTKEVYLDVETGRDTIEVDWLEAVGYEL